VNARTVSHPPKLGTENDTSVPTIRSAPTSWSALTEATTSRRLPSGYLLVTTNEPTSRTALVSTRQSRVAEPPITATQRISNERRTPMMKLQVAMYVFTIDDALKLASEVAEYIDIIELGTPLIKAAGLAAVTTVKS